MEHREKARRDRIKGLTFITWFIVSLLLSGVTGLIFIGLFSSKPTIIQNSKESVQELQHSVQRLKGLQTQFGFFTDFLRFDIELDKTAILKYWTDNDYINNALPHSTGIEDISACLPSSASKLSIDQIQSQIDLMQQSLSEDCFKKILNVKDSYITATHVSNEGGPGFQILPDAASRRIILVFSFIFWNTLFLLTLNVIKNIYDLFEKIIDVN